MHNFKDNINRYAVKIKVNKFHGFVVFMHFISSWCCENLTTETQQELWVWINIECILHIFWEELLRMLIGSLLHVPCFLLCLMPSLFYCAVWLIKDTANRTRCVWNILSPSFTCTSFFWPELRCRHRCLDAFFLHRFIMNQVEIVINHKNISCSSDKSWAHRCWILCE